MKSKDEIITILRHEKPCLLAKYPIKSLALFGSRSRDDGHEASDIDILVEITGAIGFGFVDLADELEIALGEKVDLVSSRGVKPRMMPYIQKDLAYA